MHDPEVGIPVNLCAFPEHPLDVGISETELTLQGWGRAGFLSEHPSLTLEFSKKKAATRT